MLFWKDAWCGEATFCTIFPSLFALTLHKEASMVDIWDNSREPPRGGSPLFIRLFNDWEIEEVERFFLLHNRKVISSMEDKLLLKEAKGGQFFVKLVYQSLNGHATNPFPVRTI